jgi:hypothetical protein
MAGRDAACRNHFLIKGVNRFDDLAVDRLARMVDAYALVQRDA